MLKGERVSMETRKPLDRGFSAPALSLPGGTVVSREGGIAAPGLSPLDANSILSPVVSRHFPVVPRRGVGGLQNQLLLEGR